MESWTSITREGDALPDLRMPHWKWEDPVPFESIVGRVDGEAVAIVRLFRATLTLRGLVEVQCVGVGGVFVQESHRGQGLAKRLLHAVRSNKEHYELSLVLYARDSRLYERCGFTSLSADDGNGQTIFCLGRGIVSIDPHPWWALKERF